MSKTVNLDIPRTAKERAEREADSLWGLINRMSARASDGRFYHLEDEDRAKAIAYLRGYAKMAGGLGFTQCGYCRAWASKPCGEGCCWEPAALSAADGAKP